MAFPVAASLLDACVLAILKRGETYGYILSQEMKSLIDVSESTLYPVLRRLQKSGLLAASDRPFGGRNRRYYAITDAGGASLQVFIGEWNEYKRNIDRILLGGSEQA